MQLGVGVGPHPVARKLSVHVATISGDFVGRTILRCSRYPDMQRIFLGIVFFAVTGLTFGSLVALDKLIGQ